MTDPYDHKTTKKSLRFLKSFLKMVVFFYSQVKTRCIFASRAERVSWSCTFAIL